jgi:hypothetical protein
MRSLAFVLVVSACGHHSGDVAPDGAGDDSATACLVDSDCGTGMTCQMGMCLGGCGATHVDLSYVAPNLLFVLDRSCSMRNDLAGTTTSKWQAAVDAITHVLGTYTTQVRWGATLFPDITGVSCAQDAIPVPVADNMATTISSMLTSSLDPNDPLYPDGPCVTNIDTGLQQAATDPSLLDPTRKSYLMIVTDGSQSGCNLGGGDSGSLATVTDLFKNHGVATFVVGFGSGVNNMFLNQLALAGGVPLPGATSYYEADTAAQLDQAYQTIGNLVVSCTYHVDPAPPDLSQTYVIFDHNQLVPQDPSNGWSYDAATQTLTLNGSSCDALKNHTVTAMDLVFGCPSPPIL